MENGGLEVEFQRMAMALFVAYRALRANETPVACVMVDDSTSKVVSVGYNGTNDTLNGTRHAEFIAIDYILENYIPQDKQGDINYIKAFFNNVVLYVTVEPCVMCASALKQMGIKRVVYGCGNDRFGGNGTVLYVNQDNIDSGTGNYPSYGGILRTEAIQLLRNFYIQENHTAPNPKIKLNKQIAEKEYPPNINFTGLYTQEEFSNFYSKEKVPLFYKEDVNLEVAPCSSYTLKQLINSDNIYNLPNYEKLYDAFTDHQLKDDLSTFYEFFYDIKDNKVDFSKQIVTVDTLKKRKLNDL